MLLGRVDVETLGPALVALALVLIVLYAAAISVPADRNRRLIAAASPPAGQLGPVRPVVEGR